MSTYWPRCRDPQKCLLNSRVRTGTDPYAESLILEQGADSGAELCGIAGVMQQHAADSVFNLVQVHSLPCARRQELPGPRYLSVDLRPFGSSSTPCTLGPASKSCASQRGRTHSRNLP